MYICSAFRPLIQVDGLIYIKLRKKKLQNVKKMSTEKIQSKSKALTETVKRLIYDIPKHELSASLGISRPTLDQRLIKNNWTYAEYLIINTLKDKVNEHI